VLKFTSNELHSAVREAVEDSPCISQSGEDYERAAAWWFQYFMNDLIQPRIQDAIRDIFNRLMRGEITKEAYEEAIKSATPVPVRETLVVASAPVVEADDRGQPSPSGENDLPSPSEDRQASEIVPPEDFIRDLTTHPDQETGQSQRAKLWRFLDDLEWHTTKEIAESYVYHVRAGKERNIARIASRVDELRKKYGKEVIETKDRSGPITSYRRTR